MAASPHDAVINGPLTVCLSYAEPPECEGLIVEFRLIYRGKLPAEGRSGGRAKEKHEIRKQLHRQLRMLWRDHPRLKESLIKYDSRLDGQPSMADQIANRFDRCGYRFLPLIRRDNGLACTLNLLFLRRDNPGNLVQSGGDIDNRIKVLFDALKTPDDCSELAGALPETDEDPFFCLLQDDALINEVSIVTDRLLLPQDSGEHIHDVVIIIHVTAKVIAPIGQHYV